jgi:hypothetical protein
MQRTAHLHTAHAMHISAMRGAVMGAAMKPVSTKRTSSNWPTATNFAAYANFYDGSGSAGGSFE